VFDATPDHSLKMMGISPTGVYGRAYPDPAEEVLSPASAEEVAEFKLALEKLNAVERRRHEEELPLCIASFEPFNEEPRST
jgi:hypothetical protein